MLVALIKTDRNEVQTRLTGCLIAGETTGIRCRGFLPKGRRSGVDSVLPAYAYKLHFSNRADEIRSSDGSRESRHPCLRSR